MQGLTEVMFRRVYEECFPGAIALAVSPFLSLTHGNLADAWDKIEDVLPENNVGSIPVIPQILGKEPDEFIALGNRLYELGYSELNWNMGCPMRKVAAKHRGSGILPYPDEVRSILDNVLPQLKPRLSVKVRLGLKSTDDIFRLIPVLNDYPLASVTVHPRLGRQQYNGHPDLDTFARVLPMLKASVVYNGDIVTGADARGLRERFPGVADLMVGRGVLYRPTLPLDIADPDRDTSNDLRLAAHFIERLVQEILSTMPSDQARIRKIKEYWCLVWKSLPISEMQARQVLHQEKLTIVEKMICELLQ
jgi:tRNA-dihydrouridine synthase